VIRRGSPRRGRKDSKHDSNSKTHELNTPAISHQLLFLGRPRKNFISLAQKTRPYAMTPRGLCHVALMVLVALLCVVSCDAQGARPVDAREPRRGRRQPAEPQPVGREVQVRVDRRACHRGRIAAGRASRAGHDHPRARHDARARPPGRWVTPVRRDTPAPVLDPPSPSRPVRVEPSRRAARRRRGSPRGGREPPSLLECPRLVRRRPSR